MRILSLGALLLAVGCSALGDSPGERLVRGDEGRSITVGEAEQRTKNFADRYVQLIADAVDDSKSRVRDVAKQGELHLLKLQSATSAWDIVTSSHPLQEMLDLFVQTELQALIWDQEGYGSKTFGPEVGERLVTALRNAREEIFHLARRALPDKRVEDIRNLVREWRKRNPGVEAGTFIRFGPYLDTPGADVVSQILTGFGILNLSNLNPLDSASKQVERVGEIADDAFYMAKRFPMLLQWQVEATSFGLLRTVDSVKVEGTLKSADTLLRSAAEVARAAQGTITAVERLTKSDEKPEAKEGRPEGRPFDIREYESAAREARSLLVEAGTLVESPVLNLRGQQVGAYVNDLTTRLFVYGLLLIAAFFVLLTLYRIFIAKRFQDQEPAAKAD